MGRFTDEIRKRLNIQSDEEFEALIEIEREQMESSPKYPEGKCYFCHEPTTNWDFCHGCHHYVCEDCMGEPDLVPMGEHEVGEHKAVSN